MGRRTGLCDVLEACFRHGPPSTLAPVTTSVTNQKGYAACNERAETGAVVHEIWITHETSYEFDRSVDGVELTARLRPIDDAAQAVLESELLCHPWPSARTRLADTDGTPSEQLTVRGPVRRIELRSQSRLRWSPATAATRRSPGPDEHPEPAPDWAQPGGAIWDWSARTLPDRDPDRAAIAGFLSGFRATFAFDPDATDPATPPPAFFARRRGVCQDYVGLALGCLRARGVSVQAVLGYLVRSPDGEPRFEESQPHAWLATWDPAAGWIDADPTTGLPPPSRHVVLRRGRSLAELQPVSGRLLASEIATQRLTVKVTIVKEAQ